MEFVNGRHPVRRTQTAQVDFETRLDAQRTQYTIFSIFGLHPDARLVVKDPEEDILAKIDNMMKNALRLTDEDTNDNAVEDANENAVEGANKNAVEEPVVG